MGDKPYALDDDPPAMRPSGVNMTELLNILTICFTIIYSSSSHGVGCGVVGTMREWRLEDMKS